MSLLKTFLLSLLLLGLGLYVYLIELPNAKLEEKKHQVFSDLKKDVLQSVKIESEAGSFTLENKQPQSSQNQTNSPDETAMLKSWGLQGLPDASLDQGALSALLNALIHLDLSSSIPAQDIEKDLSVYALDKPKLTLILKHEGKEQLLKFGKSNDFISKRYLSISDRTELFLIPDGLFAQASKQMDDFRDRTPLDFLDSALESIELSGKNRSEAWRIEAKPDSKWQLSEPIQAKASYSAVSNYTTALRNIRADQFIDNAADKKAQYKLDAPDYKIKLSFKPDLKRQPLELLISSLKEKNDSAEQQVSYFSIADRPSIYKSQTDLAPIISKKVEDLREKRMFEFATEQAQQLDLQFAQGEGISLLKSGQDWSVNGKPADQIFVRELLNNLSNLEALDFPLENSQFGFDNPRLKFSLRLDADKTNTPRVLVVGAKADGSQEERFYAASDDLKEPFIISQEALKRISPRLESLLKSEVTPAPLETPAK